MSKIKRIGNILNGSEVETEGDLVSAMREPPKYMWITDVTDDALADQGSGALHEFVNESPHSCFIGGSEVLPGETISWRAVKS